MKSAPIIAVLTLAWTALLPGEPAQSQDCYRKTLLQWSYGTSFEGGPELDEPMVTDRPDFTEASVTVGYGVVQIETGYTYTYDSDAAGTVRSHSYPETLLRVGTIAEWFELRFAWNYVEERTRVFGSGVSNLAGAEDLSLGCKLALTPQEYILPETALILQMSVPTGADNFTADDVLPGFNFLYAWDINDAWSTAGSSQLNRAIDDSTGDAYVEFAQSWTIGYACHDDIGAYTEWFVFAPCSADTNRTEHYLNGGFAILLSDDVQWDLRAGVGLNEAADDYFAGTGLSFRFR